MIAARFDVDEFRSLDKAERDALAELVRGPITFAGSRKAPDRFRPLLAKGLAFQSATMISATARGLEVGERVL